MKDLWEQEDASLRAEVAALRQQVQALSAQLASVDAPARWGISRSMKLVLLPVFMLLGTVGVLYGQGAMDALFIDQSGKVGIGTTTPKTTLDVMGDVNVAGSLTAGTLNVTNPANLSNTTVKGILTTEGDVGIGEPSPKAKLDVRGKGGADVDLIVSGRIRSNSTAGGVWLSDQNDGFVGNNSGNVGFWTNGEGVGFNAFQIQKATGNVGIGTIDPKAKLDVVGDIKAASVNGEKPPLVFEIGQKNDTANWHHVEQDIGPLCGDADGCTMKFFLRHSLTDEVRTIAEQIYIEQPDKSNNKEAGLRGWARQLGGGDSSFILQTPNKYEIVPHPWEWIWVFNYSHQNVGPISNAYSSYQVQFLTHPHVTATVIIYDR